MEDRNPGINELWYSQFNMPSSLKIYEYMRF